MKDQCLVVDAGHTRVKFAACRRLGPQALPDIVQSMAVIHGDPIDWTQIAGWFSDTPPSDVVIIGTNLARAQAIKDQWPAALPAPVLFNERRRLPLQVDVDFPEKVGIDRLLNAVAGNLLRAPKQPVITVGTGTAITVDVVDAEGVFRGGAILPGILLGAKSLHEETTTLPHVNVWELLKNEPAILGRNTEAAIASGLYWGHLGSVREMITRYTAWLKPLSTQEPLVLLTGGACGILAPYLTGARVEVELPVRGLAAVAEQLRVS